MKIALDANVIVAAFGTRGLCADLCREIFAHHEVRLSPLVLDESRRALREKFGLGEPDLSQIQALLQNYLFLPERPASRTPPESAEIRDRADALVLADAIAAGAEVLVTGDRDLLEARAIRGIRIVSPRELWTLLFG